MSVEGVTLANVQAMVLVTCAAVALIRREA